MKSKIAGIGVGLLLANAICQAQPIVLLETKASLPTGNTLIQFSNKAGQLIGTVGITNIVNNKNTNGLYINFSSPETYTKEIANATCMFGSSGRSPVIHNNSNLLLNQVQCMLINIQSGTCDITLSDNPITCEGVYTANNKH